MKIWLILCYDRARRNIIIKSPRHADETKGTFSLRNPVRPNPISIQASTITETSIETGSFGIDKIYAFHAMPILDIKLWRDGIDIPPLAIEQDLLKQPAGYNLCLNLSRAFKDV